MKLISLSSNLVRKELLENDILGEIIWNQTKKHRRSIKSSTAYISAEVSSVANRAKIQILNTRIEMGR